jgi:hypothetical protein
MSQSTQENVPSTIFLLLCLTIFLAVIFFSGLHYIQATNTTKARISVEDAFRKLGNPLYSNWQMERSEDCLDGLSTEISWDNGGFCGFFKGVTSLSAVTQAWTLTGKSAKAFLGTPVWIKTENPVSLIMNAWIDERNAYSLRLTKQNNGVIWFALFWK